MQQAETGSRLRRPVGPEPADAVHCIKCLGRPRAPENAHLERWVVQGGSELMRMRNRSRGLIRGDTRALAVPLVQYYVFHPRRLLVVALNRFLPGGRLRRHAANDVTNKLRFTPAFLTTKFAFPAPDVARVFRYSGRQERPRTCGSRGHARRGRFLPALQLEQGSLGGAHAGCEAA
jgi:hypothetical protein